MSQHPIDVEPTTPGFPSFWNLAVGQNKDSKMTLKLEEIGPKDSSMTDRNTAVLQVLSLPHSFSGVGNVSSNISKSSHH